MQDKVLWFCGFKCMWPFGLHSCVALEGGSHIYLLLLIFPLHCLNSFACWLVWALYLPRHSCSWWSPLSAIWSLQEVKHLPAKPPGLSTARQEFRLGSAQQPCRICVLLVLSFHAAARSTQEAKAPVLSGEQGKAGHPPGWVSVSQDPELQAGWGTLRRKVEVLPRTVSKLFPLTSVQRPQWSSEGHLWPHTSCRLQMCHNELTIQLWPNLFPCSCWSVLAHLIWSVLFFSLRSYQTGTN